MDKSPTLRIVGHEPKKKCIMDLTSKPCEVSNQPIVPERKRKKKWVPWTRTKALPISLNGIKSYIITLRSESDEFIDLLIWTKHPIVSMRRICSKPRSFRELLRLDKAIVDDINL